MLLSLARDANCIDVGANVGKILSSILAAAPDGRHIAFEPVRHLRESLMRRFPMVDVRGEAVADYTGMAEFDVVPDLPSRSGLSTTLALDQHWRTEKVSVPVISLDEAVDDQSPPALIKIDVEGGELGVVRGAERILRQFRPTLAFEHQKGSSGTVNRKATDELYAALHGHGYRVFDMDGAEQTAGRFMDCYLRGARWNFVAHS